MIAFNKTDLQNDDLFTKNGDLYYIEYLNDENEIFCGHRISDNKEIEFSYNTKIIPRTDIELYYYDHKDFLELSDRHVLFYIKNEINPELYCIEVDNFIDAFRKKYNVDIYTLGRMGRHICMDITKENIKNYAKLQKAYQKLEKDFINFMNGNYNSIDSKLAEAQNRSITNDNRANDTTHPKHDNIER